MSVEIKVLVGEICETILDAEKRVWFRPHIIMDMSSDGGVSVEDIAPSGGTPCHILPVLSKNDEQEITADAYGHQLIAYIPSLVVERIRKRAQTFHDNRYARNRWMIAVQMIENWILVNPDRALSVVLYGY